MFYGYRFEPSGKYHSADELETVDEVFAYVMEHKPHYPRVIVTARGTDDIQVEAIHGQIEYPKQWALLEIQQVYLTGTDFFNGPAFVRAMEQAGFQVPQPQDDQDAYRMLQAQYAGLFDSTK